MSNPRSKPCARRPTQNVVKRSSRHAEDSSERDCWPRPQPLRNTSELNVTQPTQGSAGSCGAAKVLGSDNRRSHVVSSTQLRPHFRLEADPCNGTDEMTQKEMTALLFEASWQDPDRFVQKIQEIYDIFGEEEGDRQIKLLENPYGHGRSREFPSYALTILPEYCHKILHRGKTWEIRGQACRKHLNERICIAESGSGMLVGEMTIRECLRVSREDLEANPQQHMIDNLDVIQYKTIYAWIVTDVGAYSQPVPYQRPVGTVNWVDLNYYKTERNSKKLPGATGCARADCNFGLGKQGGRGRPYVRHSDGTKFEHCLFCSSDALLAALHDHDGQSIHRALARLARRDAAVRNEAFQRIQNVLEARVASRFAPRGQKRKLASLSWDRVLEHRQPLIRVDEQSRAAFAAQESKCKERLRRKFPSIYAEDAREESKWMPPRAAAFRTWCLEDSWRACSKCRRMVPQPFQASHAKGSAKRDPQFPACSHCKSAGSQGYWAPTPEDVPRKLRKLSVRIIEALRPFDVHTGGTFRAPNGYLVHSDMMQFSFKRISVEDALAKLSKRERRRGEKALLYLLRSRSPSAYARFWQLHHRFLDSRHRAIQRGETWSGAPVKRLPANFIETVGLECALWPHLYWSLDMTETYVRSQDARRLRRVRQSLDADIAEEEGDNADTGPSVGTRQSAKASFLAKVHSAVIGYNSDEKLLHFVYDLWLFTTLGGAKNSAGIGIREALASKPYSPEMWRTYHTALVDLQKQIGWPSLFITIAPYEWSFPYHRWLEDSGSKECSLASYVSKVSLCTDHEPVGAVAYRENATSPGSGRTRQKLEGTAAHACRRDPSLGSCTHPCCERIAGEQQGRHLHIWTRTWKSLLLGG